MNLIFIGDVVGKGGREAVRILLPELKREFNAQIAVANGENSAAGAGLTEKCVRELHDAGADVVTGGDHTWDQKNFDRDVDNLSNFIRPANFSSLQPGRGWGVFRNPGGGEYAVMSLTGQVFMRDSACNPFEQAEKTLAEIPVGVKNIFVDFHAEATSEKLAMWHFLDGKVTAIIGTHTHVPTADAAISKAGTAYLSDVGMTGAAESVLGRSVTDVIRKFRTGMPGRLEVVESGVMRLDFAVIDYDYRTGKARGIQNYSRLVEVK